MARVCREVAEGFGFDRVTISSFDEGRGLIKGVAGYGVADDLLQLELPLSAVPLHERAREAHQLVFVGNAREEEALPADLVKQFDVTSVFSLPLFSGGRCLGFLSGDHAGAHFELDQDEKDVLETAGVIAAILLEKSLVEEELRRLDDAKTRFVAFAAHELRTPIQAVYGMLATVHHRGSELSDEQLVTLRSTAFAQAGRLRALADQLLDLSRLDSAAYSVTPRPVVVRRAVEESVLMVAEQHAGAVVIEIPSDLEVTLDPKVLDRVVANLVQNALRYGAPPVEIAAERQDRHFRLSVRDGGSGIPPEDAAALFDRFARAPTSTGIDGSGLGLAIAREFARAHGGDLLYMPADPGGTCFEFALPIQP